MGPTLAIVRGRSSRLTANDATASSRQGQVDSRPRAATAQARPHRKCTPSRPRREGALPPKRRLRRRAQGSTRRHGGRMRGGGNEDAVALFERALALEPGLRDARNELGWTLLSSGPVRTGRGGVPRSRTPRDPRRRAWTGLGYARLQSGDYPGRRARPRARGDLPLTTRKRQGARAGLPANAARRPGDPLLRQVLARRAGG